MIFFVSADETRFVVVFDQAAAIFPPKRQQARYAYTSPHTSSRVRHVRIYRRCTNVGDCIHRFEPQDPCAPRTADAAKSQHAAAATASIAQTRENDSRSNSEPS